MQTGIYAIESPGGWQLIGRTPLELFDLHRHPLRFSRPGDYARFFPIHRKGISENIEISEIKLKIINLFYAL